MQLEKLDLLETRLGRFIERFHELVAENKRLRGVVEADAERLKDMERRLGTFREEREALRNKLESITGVIEQLERLQEAEAGESD